MSSSPDDSTSLISENCLNKYGSTDPESHIHSPALISDFVAVGKASFPLITTLFLQYSISVFAIISVGGLGKNELAAVSLATITYNVGNSIFNGMATSLDTFCAQAYGSGNHRLVGMYFQRGSAMLLVTSIPVLLFWCFSASILKFIVPQKELLLLAQTYLRYLSFGAPGYILFETGKRFLQCQGIYSAGQFSIFLVVPINVGLNYLLVWNKSYGIGFVGAPISIAISYWLMSLFLLLYVLFIDGKKCWFGLELRQAFKLSEWSSMFGLAINGTAMLLSEFIAFEILTLAASRFGTTALAAQSIASTTATMAFQIPFGVSVALSTKIADRVGLQDLAGLRRLTRVTYTVAGILGVLDAGLLIFFRFAIGRCFTSDKRVLIVSLKILTILGINQLYDCANIILAGFLRGQGRQAIGSRLNLMIYYLIAVPLSLILAFYFGLDLYGLWIGLGVGIFVLALSELYFVYNTRWFPIFDDARQRLQN